MLAQNIALELQSRWQRLGDSLSFDPSVWTQEWNAVSEAYSGVERHYHNLQHLQQMFVALESVKLDRRLLVELAVFYHDVVYDARQPDNEEASARWAVERLSALGLDATAVSRVEALILATKSHQVDAGDADGAAFLDADLAVLGGSADEYDHYAKMIRLEYAFVEESRYRLGRKQVLESFLKRDRIYKTKTFFDRKETAARENLNREILSL